MKRVECCKKDVRAQDGLDIVLRKVPNATMISVNR
jgi:hypothetical protein